MGIEPTSRVRRLTGFEDQGSHQTPFTSMTRIARLAGKSTRDSRKSRSRNVGTRGPPAYLTNGSVIPEPANVARANSHA